MPHTARPLTPKALMARVVMLACLAEVALARPAGCRVAGAPSATAQQIHVGGGFEEERRVPLLDHAAICGAMLDAPTARSTIGAKGSTKLWSDATTRHNLAKATRVLKLHILKYDAINSKLRLLGLEKYVSMVFILRKFPSSLKALPIPLPHCLGHPAEGLFLKTSTGKKVLSVHVGKGDMPVEALVANGTAVAHAVRKNLDTHLVREIRVEVDRLSLPVWNGKLSDRGKQRRSSKPGAPRLLQLKNASMAPPAQPPAKKLRTA